MDFLGDVATTVAKKLVVDRSFKAGQRGESPLVFSDSEVGRELQHLADKAYQSGQQSVLVKIGNKIVGSGEE